MRRRLCLLLLAAWAFGLWAARIARAEPKNTDPNAASAANLPSALAAVAVEEKLGALVPPKLTFTNSKGRTLELGEVVGTGKPTILILAYYECPMLCGLTVRGVARALAKLKQRLGSDYTAVTISFDPEDRPESAFRARTRILSELGKSSADPVWPFLIGKRDNIDVLTRTLGFHYARDERSGEYAHPSVIFIIDREGRVARYVYGLDFDARSLERTLFAETGGVESGVLSQVVNACFRYTPAARAYGRWIMVFLRGGSVLFLATALVGGYWWGRRRRRARP